MNGQDYEHVSLFRTDIILFCIETETEMILTDKETVSTGHGVCLVFPGKPNWRRSPSTVDLLVLISLYQLVLVENIINLLNKTNYLNEEVNGTEPSLSVSVPWYFTCT